MKKTDKEISILWANGEITTGDSWKEIEENIRACQWHTYSSQSEFRKSMLNRARIVSGNEPTSVNTSKQFIQRLAEHNMFLIYVSDGQGTENISG
jgi:hypothetical protein